MTPRAMTMFRCRRLLLIFLAASQLLFAGCGGSTQDDMRRYAIRRKPDKDEAETEPAAPSPADVTPAKTLPSEAPEATLTPAGGLAVEAPTITSAVPMPNVATEESTPNRVADSALVDLSQSNAPPTEPLSPAKRRERTANNMKAIGIAWRAYLDDKGYFPGPVVDATKKPLLSWRVDLLPYLGLQSLHDAFHLNEPWNSPHNLTLVDKIPSVFQSPERFDTDTNYLALLLGGTTVHQERRKVSERNVEDGIENTLALVEVDEDQAVPWTKPAELPLNIKSPLKSLGTLRENGFFAVWSDGEASWIDGAVTPELFAKACTIDSGDGFRGAEIANELSIGVALPIEETAVAMESEPDAAISVDEAEPTVVAKPRPTLSDVQASLMTEKNTPTDLNFHKQAAPPASDLKVARDILRELYQADYAAATTATQRLQLARKMLDRLLDLSGDFPGQYALLEIVQQIAIQTGSVDVALDATEQLNMRFELKRDPLLEVIEKLTRTAKDRRSQDQLLEEAEAVFDEFVFDEKFEEAERLSQLAVALASKLNDKDRIDKFTSRRNWAAAAHSLSELAEEGLFVLSQNPEDPKANGDVGKFHCLVKGDWDNGLVILANGNDRSLRRLAEMELSVIDESQRQLELADLWWREAESASPVFRGAMQSRAKHWYQQSLAGLPAGLIRIRVERRIADIASGNGGSSWLGPPKAQL
ncbi:MAG: DUF1559 domain-containing protein [Planctomycetaceae bacterium]|nr:DUF1559 domain-containing protein [Planctomycetaceae bacterium]